LPAAVARIGAGALRRRVLRRSRARVVLPRFGFAVDADLDTAIGMHLYRHGWCDVAASAIAQLARPGDVVIDGGANVGLFALAASTVVGATGAVHAVEAAPATAELLRRNVAMNPGRPIEVHELALADREGELDFVTFEAGSGLSSFAPAASGAVTRVRATTLDALTAPMARVDLVKLDLEGAELRALRGASELLRSRRPALLIELEPAHLARQDGSVAELQALLSAAGYEAFGMTARASGGVTFTALEQEWTRPAGEPNVVLLPAERGAPHEGS
jgi:FkbM family methyltransferase